jgi:hypothetical protein
VEIRSSSLLEEYMKIINCLVVLVLSTSLALAGTTSTSGTTRKVASEPAALTGVIYDDTGMTIQIPNPCVTKKNVGWQIEENEPMGVTFNWTPDKTCTSTSKNGSQVRINYSDFHEGNGGQYTVSNPLTSPVMYDMTK